MRGGTATTYTVTKVRKADSSDGRHRHIEGVITAGGYHYTRREVVDSIKAGNIWKASAGGYSSTLHPMSYCPRANCSASPYIATNPDSTKFDNLENLPQG